MQKSLYKLIVPALLSTCFIDFTAIISQGSYSLTSFGRFCFLFNVIPSDVGFLSGGKWIFCIYYPLLFIILTLLFWWVGHLIQLYIDKLNVNQTK